MYLICLTHLSYPLSAIEIKNRPGYHSEAVGVDTTSGLRGWRPDQIVSNGGHSRRSLSPTFPFV